MSKKSSIYLFNEENPRGEMFNLSPEEIEQHLEDGWLDSPEGLNLPESDDTGLTTDQVENARPEDLVKLVESYGFVVLTPEQLKAEANKMAETVLDLTKFDDDEIIAEAERRGLKEKNVVAVDITELLERFAENPEGLNKDELVALGNNGYSLGLRSNMKEETLIAKINEQLNGE